MNRGTDIEDSPSFLALSSHTLAPHASWYSNVSTFLLTDGDIVCSDAIISSDKNGIYLALDVYDGHDNYQSWNGQGDGLGF